MSESSLRATLGDRLRALRRERGMTQEAIAAHLDVSPRYYAGVERGERNLTLDSVDALAAQLGVPAVFLLQPDLGRPAVGPVDVYPAPDAAPATAPSA